MPSGMLLVLAPRSLCTLCAPPRMTSPLCSSQVPVSSPLIPPALHAIPPSYHLSSHLRFLWSWLYLCDVSVFNKHSSHSATTFWILESECTLTFLFLVLSTTLWEAHHLNPLLRSAGWGFHQEQKLPLRPGFSDSRRCKPRLALRGEGLSAPSPPPRLSPTSSIWSSGFVYTFIHHAGQSPHSCPTKSSFPLFSFPWTYSLFFLLLKIVHNLQDLAKYCLPKNFLNLNLNRKAGGLATKRLC